MSKLVSALLVSPEFTDQHRAGINLPYINYCNVDWESICSLMGDVLRATKNGLRLSVANDAIDNVTFDLLAEESRETGEKHILFPFGEKLREQVSHNNTSVIDVSDAWDGMQPVYERCNAPPPVLIPFVITGEVDNIIDWILDSRDALMMCVDILAEGPGDAPVKGGVLPNKLKTLFTSAFGIGFQDTAMIVPLEIPEKPILDRTLLG